jgi:hypothetical protein
MPGKITSLLWMRPAVARDRSAILFALLIAAGVRPHGNLVAAGVRPHGNLVAAPRLNVASIIVYLNWTGISVSDRSTSSN